MTDIQPERELIDKIVDIFRPLIKDEPSEYQAHILSQCRHELKPLLQVQRSRICGEVLEYIGMHEADTSAGQRIKAKVQEVERNG